MTELGTFGSFLIFSIRKYLFSFFKKLVTYFCTSPKFKKPNPSQINYQMQKIIFSYWKKLKNTESAQLDLLKISFSHSSSWEGGQVSTVLRLAAAARPRRRRKTTAALAESTKRGQVFFLSSLTPLSSLGLPPRSSFLAGPQSGENQIGFSET